MIFVTVGTGRFERLVKSADYLASKIKEKIILQKGTSNYVPKNAEYVGFTEDFKEYIRKARIVISHGGAGIIFELLNQGKKVIAIANLKRIDKHQREILEELGKENYLIHCKDFDLNEGLEKIKSFKFKKYKKPKCWIDKEIINFLN